MWVLYSWSKENFAFFLERANPNLANFSEAQGRGQNKGAI